MFSTPAEESPGAGAEAPAPAARAALVGGEVLDRGLAVLSVGERLEQFRRTREGAGISDAFAAVGGWFEKAAQKQAPVTPMETHVFTLLSLSGNLARVNGTVLSLGHDAKEVLVDKATGRRALVRLVSVDKRSAVIETDGQRLELSLGGPENEKK